MPAFPNQQLPVEAKAPWSGWEKNVNWANVTLVSSIIIFILIIAIFSYWFFILKPVVESQPPEVANREATSSPRVASPSAKKDETELWRIYSSVLGKYKLKYPLNYQKIEIKEEDLDPYTHQNIFVSPDFEAATRGEGFTTPGRGSAYWVDVCEKRQDCLPKISILGNEKVSGQKTNVKDYLVDDVEGKRFNFTDETGEKYTIVEIEKSGFLYSIRLNYGRHNVTQDELKIFDLALSAFKFTE